jgi:long-chain acyl-CoA synthetase
MSDKRIFDLLYDQLDNYPQPKAYGHKVKDEWLFHSTEQIVTWVNECSLGLLRLGVKPGDKVASVIYKCCPEWVVLDFALAQIGALHVPMYPTISSREYEYILNEAEVAYCFVGEGDLYDKVNAAKKSVVSLKEIFTFYVHPVARPWTAIFQKGDLSEVNRIKDSIKADDWATIIYTSGTTGNPKGVILTHRNIIFNVEAMRNNIPLLPGEVSLSFLPISHVFERVVLYAYTSYGASVVFSTPDNLGGETGDLKTVKPVFFTAVPRLLEKVFEKIYGKGLELKGIKRALFFWAMGMAEVWDFDQKVSGFQAFKWKIAQKLIFSKWREAFGGNLKGIITGASACPVRIMRVFNAAGIPVREGYGMTESAPGLTFSRLDPHMAMLGAVGPALENVEIKILPTEGFKDDEGEILAKGDGIMVGYYKQPEKTAEMIRYIDGERWLATGDIGKLIEGKNGVKFLKITDRKKELLKTSLGKYVAPAPIESKLKEHRLVEQAMIVGNDVKFVSALIIPSTDGLKEWCLKHQVPWTTMHDLVQHPKVQNRYQMLLDRINPDFGHSEQVKKFALLATTWDAVKQDGTEAELTPTMKLKRRVISTKFNKEIEKMYE